MSRIPRNKNKGRQTQGANSLGRQVAPHGGSAPEVDTLVQQRIEAYQGPLPPTEMLEWYEQRISDAPERFLKMVENQAAHRIMMERFVSQWDIWLALVGQLCTVAIVLAFLAAATVIIVVNHASTPSVIGGSVLGGLDLVGLASLLITREVRKGRSNREE